MRGEEVEKKRRRNVHLYSRLSRAKLCQSACALFLPLLFGYPHVFLVGDLDGLLVEVRGRLPGVKITYQVGKHGTTQEHHVPPSRGVFDADLEFLGFVSYS